jgi:hypothetical protein
MVRKASPTADKKRWFKFRDKREASVCGNLGKNKYKNA